MRNTAVAAALLSVLLLAAFAYWFRPDWQWLAGYAGMAMLAALSVPILYRVAGFTRADELEWLEQRETAEHEAMLSDLSQVRGALAALDIAEGVRQADTLSAMLSDYHAVVETRFRGKSRGPLAYLATARRVQKHAVQNLVDAVATGHSLASIARHDRLDGEQSRSTTPEIAETNVRGDRLQNLENEQELRLNGLLETNRQLFDALTDTAVEVANIRAFSEYERLDTLARLVSLAEIASQTGKK
ncbi:MAG: hypothetical protein V3U76_04610 [Granulosicoccus sp.]